MKIDGVKITAMRQIPDDRGKVMHILRTGDDGYVGFGEVYTSVVYPGIVKAWHLHKVMTLNYAVVFGMIRLALFDDRESSPTRGQFQEVYLGESNYVRVTIPPLVWNGFKGLGVMPAIVVNCSDTPHDPSEIVRVDPVSGPINYNWQTVWR